MPVKEPLSGFKSLLNILVKMYILAAMACLISGVIGYECDDCDPDQLCCMDSFSGELNCCEYVDGVCCSGGTCCPEGFFCSQYSSKCFKIPKYMQKRQGYLGDKAPTFKNGRFHRCDEHSFCVGTFCCPYADGTYGCCPFKPAVCCKDKQRCCESDETCDESSEYCIMKEGIILLSEATRPAVFRKSPVFFQR
ncbi:hypothetical protein TNIN_25761 [Trichonephila inaurata madagascariensis]|uniref:Granulins domain-containing protein n=1 Tax=Trichonephila inaurata madagascariensis TaxID=2747483 RepID=A0A8X6YEA8_9ARAC|nr:hypothetical protein TNIN_25761 [Trichonephila inaurata madagascariensis]